MYRIARVLGSVCEHPFQYFDDESVRMLSVCVCSVCVCARVRAEKLTKSVNVRLDTKCCNRLYCVDG